MAVQQVIQIDDTDSRRIFIRIVLTVRLNNPVENTNRNKQTTASSEDKNVLSLLR